MSTTSCSETRSTLLRRMAQSSAIARYAAERLEYEDHDEELQEILEENLDAITHYGEQLERMSHE